MSRRNTAEVFDLGYQYYEGPREGRSRARWAVYVNGLRTALGIGRGPMAKVLAILMFVAAMAPAVIFAVIASLADPLTDVLPSHADYYEIISIILFLFAAIIGPELLCPDRRNGVISLYLVRPMTPTDYVAGRWLAFFTVTIILVYSGQLVLLAGLVLSSADPGEYLKDNWLDIPRILGAGLVVSLFVATVPLAVAAFTDRRAYAAAFVIGLFIITVTVAAVLTGCRENGDQSSCERLTGSAARWLSLIDVGSAPSNVNNIIFDKDDRGITGDLPSAVPVLWYGLLTAGPALLLWRRYNNMST